MIDFIPTAYLPLIAVALYAVAMFVIRKIQTGEPFDLNKLLQALGLGAVATAALYLATGTVPGVEAIIEQMTSWAPNNASLATVGALAWGLFDQYILKGKATGKPLISSVSTIPAVPATEPGSATPAFPAGKASFLGIYANSISSGFPSPSYTCDVNQVPEIIAEVMTLVTGKLFCSVLIDGAPLKDCQEIALNLSEVGKKNWLPMWIPQAYRVAGTHVLTIKTGHLEGAENITPGGTDSKIVYDGAVYYSLIFTGTKKE